MTSEKMIKALNDQIKEELASAYLYLAMAADFEAKGLSGFAQWLKVQTQEEVEHALKLYDYINERGYHATFQALDKPKETWETPLAAFKQAYEHEVYISKCIDTLVKQAREEDDIATENFLQWFVAEQVEEEDSADTIVQKIEMAKDSKNGIYMLDKELAGRKSED